ncbi:MAG TPA: permease, partial [Lachnospiraceae bacterium]|nr:permease [Lachnospiraceae bacterium]
VAAMFMSACSTSNAFIGKSFSNNFAAVPILAFIVTGPMLDLKNMIMLSEILKKRFLLLLAALVILESALVFGTLSFFM